MQDVVLHRGSNEGGHFHAQLDSSGYSKPDQMGRALSIGSDFLA